MIQFELKCNLMDAVSLLSETLGERKYWLHRRAGGDKWNVEFGRYGCLNVNLADGVEHYASYLILKLER